jgi:hypothetical protein
MFLPPGVMALGPSAAHPASAYDEGPEMTTAALAAQSPAQRPPMLQRLLPRRADNDFAGQPLAIGLLALVVLARLVMSGNSMLNTALVAGGADGMPLAAYGPAGAQAVLGLFALLGLLHLTIASLGLVVLLRYRSLIPLFSLVMLAQALGTQALHRLRPIGPETPGAPGDVITLVLLAALVASFVLALMPNSKASR